MERGILGNFKLKNGGYNFVLWGKILLGLIIKVIKMKFMCFVIVICVCKDLVI